MLEQHLQGKVSPPAWSVLSLPLPLDPTQLLYVCQLTWLQRRAVRTNAGLRAWG